jgi:hypothetical protein
LFSPLARAIPPFQKRASADHSAASARNKVNLNALRGENISAAYLAFAGAPPGTAAVLPCISFDSFTGTFEETFPDPTLIPAPLLTSPSVIPSFADGSALAAYKAEEHPHCTAPGQFATAEKHPQSSRYLQTPTYNPLGFAKTG